MSRDPLTGKTNRLNKQQLDSIQKNGSFKVESLNFKGKSHKWLLANWIQKGSLNINKSFYKVFFDKKYPQNFNFAFKELAIAFHLLIVTAKRRFYYKTFSFLQGLKSWCTGFKNLFDIFIGIPAMYTKNYSTLIRKDLTKFLLAELTFDVSFFF